MDKIKCYKCGKDVSIDISKALDDVIYLLSLIYIDFTLIMGLTMDMETFNMFNTHLQAVCLAVSLMYKKTIQVIPNKER